MSARDLKEDHVWQQSVELQEFVQGALTGRLQFAPALNAKIPLEVIAAEAECWKCKRPTNIVTELVFAASRVFPGHPDIHTSIHELAEASNGIDDMKALFPASDLQTHGIGAIKPRYSKTVGAAYMSNGCLHCDALQGQWFEHEVMDAGEKAFELDVTLKPEWAEAMADSRSSVYCWWFDARATQS